MPGQWAISKLLLRLLALWYEDVYKLDLDTLQPGGLAAQVLDAIETGNAEELRKIAIAKRVEDNDIPLNESNVMTQFRILNNVRKDNLYLTSNSWLQRNVVAGAMVNFSNGQAIPLRLRPAA